MGQRSWVSFFFSHVLIGVCGLVLGGQFSCQRFSRDKPVVDIYQFLAGVCGPAKTEQEGRRSKTSELREETAVASLSASE